MGLSNDLLTQFARITRDDNKAKTSTTKYGTAVKYGDEMYVRIDGSDMLTPMESTVVAKPGDRVVVTIENHQVVATGNLTTPSARSDTVGSLSDQVFHKVTADEIDAVNASLDNITAITVKTEYAEIVEADIEKLRAKLIDTEHLSADDIKAINAEIENLEAKVGTFEILSADELQAIFGEITNLKGYTADYTYVSAEILDAVKAQIKELKVTVIDAETGNFKFANVDFSNIGKAAMEYFYAQSGLIKDVTIGDQTITGELVGVTIRGDLIEGNTVVADKLVIKGKDGLYYKLNTDGVTTETEQTDYNSLNGQIIRAKSITAEKIKVEDLVAFGATIGGFKIGDTSIYSGVKESVDNKTRGIYMDNQGQIAFGDATNFIKYYKDQNGNYRLEVSAESIVFGSSGTDVEEAVKNAQAAADAAIVSSIEQFYHSDSPTELTGGKWSLVEPIWTDGKYVWRRTKNTYGDGHTDYTPSESGVCITGNTGTNGTSVEVTSSDITYATSASGTTAPTSGWGPNVPTVANGQYLWTKTVVNYSDGNSTTSYSVSYKGTNGADGKDAIVLSITSSNGTVFKNNSGSTVLTAHVFVGGVEQSITEAGVVENSLGSIKWYKGTDTTPVATAKTLTVSADDVTNTQTYKVQLEG